MAVYVHNNSWYISLPCSVKQQCEMTKFCFVVDDDDDDDVANVRVRGLGRQ